MFHLIPYWFLSILVCYSYSCASTLWVFGGYYDIFLDLLFTFASPNTVDMLPQVKIDF